MMTQEFLSYLVFQLELRTSEFADDQKFKVVEDTTEYESYKLHHENHSSYIKPPFLVIGFDSNIDDRQIYGPIIAYVRAIYQVNQGQQIGADYLNPKGTIVRGFYVHLSAKSLKEIIEIKKTDPWVGTMFEGYVHVSAKTKGNLGEIYVEQFLVNVMNLTVKKAPSATAGFDRYVNGKKVEIKFSLATRNAKDPTKVDKNSFVFNHVSCNKDWEILILCGINSMKDYSMIYITKYDFINNIDRLVADSVFNIQQGGKKLKNDDYMCSNISLLKKYSIVKDISTLSDVL